MAMSPSSLLAKLDELKKWQQIQQEKLLKQHNSRLEEVNRSPLNKNEEEENMDKYLVENVSTLSMESFKKQQQVQQDDESLNLTNKPKQPFLKRGSGLGKYGLKYGDHKKPFNKMKPQKIYKTALHKRITQIQSSDSINTAVSNRNVNKERDKSAKAKNMKDSPFITSSITPLKVPEINMFQKAKWCSVEEENVHQPIAFQSQDANRDEVESSNNDFDDDRVTTPINALQANPTLLLCLQKLASAHFSNSSTLDHSDLLNKIALNETTMYQTPSNNNNNVELIKYLQNLVKKYENNTPVGDLTTYENALEKELHVFEQLEQKVMNSSFSSTNSSVVELLASTPNRITKVPTFETIQEGCGPSTNKVTQGTQDNFIDESLANVSSKNAKKMLIYPHEREEYSDESSVNSEDFERTINEPRSGNNREVVMVRQNACTMTEPTDEINEELLKDKLQELEIEIASFRTENRKLEKVKVDLERERLDFQRSKKCLEKEYNENREQLEYEIEEERKKLQKEKNVFEKYTKDLQNKPNRKEREEILNLKTELANVRETLKLKEARSGTSQARLRNQIKSLEKENCLLKEELEKLQKENAKLLAKHSNKKSSSDTKMLHEINKNLSKLTKEQKVVKLINKLETSIEEKDACEDSLIMLCNNNKGGKKQANKAKVKYSSEAQYSLDDDDLEEEESEESLGPNSFENHKLSKSRSKSKINLLSDNEEADSARHQTKLQNSEYQTEYRSSYARPRADFNYGDDEPVILSKLQNLRRSRSSLESKSNKENDKNSSNGNITTFRNLSDLSITENYEKVFGGTSHPRNTTENCKNTKLTRHDSLNDTQNSNKVETVLSDGSKETKYPNGNVKTISADGNFIKMAYFNGDLKETQLLDGNIRYFYKETQIWQTTFSNGDETFEFPDGQVEKHFADGSSHVQFPNGIIKDVTADGTEQINYPDGSIVNIKKNGEKVLLLPNGQKEIHTEAHKRREYPDGTVKIIYPDGLQETRYSNGRIRMKDKDGNLIMDSHKD